MACKEQEEKIYRFRSDRTVEEWQKVIEDTKECRSIEDEDGIKIELKTRHGGTDYFYGKIMQDGNGTTISGVIKTEPFFQAHNKEKSSLSKMARGLLYVVIFPFALIITLFAYIIIGIQTLYLKMKGKYQKEPNAEEILVDLMTNKLHCRADDE